MGERRPSATASRDVTTRRSGPLSRPTGRAASDRPSRVPPAPENASQRPPQPPSPASCPLTRNGGQGDERRAPSEPLSRVEAGARCGRPGLSPDSSVHSGGRQPAPGSTVTNVRGANGCTPPMGGESEGGAIGGVGAADDPPSPVARFRYWASSSRPRATASSRRGAGADWSTRAPRAAAPGGSALVGSGALWNEAGSHGDDARATPAAIAAVSIDPLGMPLGAINRV